MQEVLALLIINYIHNYQYLIAFLLGKRKREVQEKMKRWKRKEKIGKGRDGKGRIGAIGQTFMIIIINTVTVTTTVTVPVQ